MSTRRLLVTHHAPDLDAISAVWLLKRFVAQDFADAKVGFVNPGETIALEEAEHYGAQLHEVVHVDTGFGEFDHHQPERAMQRVCATSLVYDYACKIHPDLKDDEALALLVEHVNQVDHFEEIYWPDSSAPRNLLMIQDLIKGCELTDPHDDESQLYFGFACLEKAYAVLTQHCSAQKIISEKGQEFQVKAGKCLAIETSNDDTIKLAQKMGCVLVVRKDPKLGIIRVKVRPDADLTLHALADRVKALDPGANWFFHGSGKMLLNGSSKDRIQKPSKLLLEQMVTVIKELYG